MGDDPVAPSAAENIPRLTPRELDVLQEVGRHWRSVLRDRLGRLAELPVDPTLRFHHPPGRGRFVEMSLFRPEGPDELEATEEAVKPVSRAGRLVDALQRIVVGPPLRSSAVAHERMRKLVALPVLSSDLLSSVAYGPEAMLSVLVLAGAVGLRLALPLAAVVVVLMIAVGASYRQTIAAYPSGAGSYIVAGDNLGELAGLAAAVGLLADYVLTVAVSIAAGIAAITSALPSLERWTVPLGLAAITLLLAGNLRGVREAGHLFAAPTYLFLLAMGILISVGLAHAASRGFTANPPPHVNAVEGLTVLLALRAFSSGATSMTGIESVANAVPAFEPPEWRNARATLAWMIFLLVALFAGLMILIYLDGVVPRPGETLLSQLAHIHLGSGVLYGFVQAATALILLFAANTAFNGFPRLLYFMAREQHAPRAFLQMGDRLAFSNGILVLGVAAAVIYIAFRGNTESLIPLFAVGVFLAVTLSQAGMVVRSWRTPEHRSRTNLIVNGLGCILSAVVLLVAAVTKFTEGAWVVVVGIPVVIWLCLRVRSYYRRVREAITLRPPVERSGPWSRHEEGSAAEPVGAGPEQQESPDQVRHLFIVAVERLDLANLRALAYAASLGQPLLAVHIAPGDEEADRFREEWETWAVPLAHEVVVSPYRALVAPLAHYVGALHAQQPNLTTTVILAELVARGPWHQLLQSQVAPRLRLALRSQPEIVIATIPFHIPG